MTINLHIERLVIEDMDWDGGADKALSRAVSQEIRQKLAIGGLGLPVHEDTAYTSIRGGNVAIGPSEPVSVLGKNIANAIYRGIGPRAPAPPRDVPTSDPK